MTMKTKTSFSALLDDAWYEHEKYRPDLSGLGLLLLNQEQIADLLVARGWAMRKPLREHRCWKTIELKAINDGCGNLYVTEHGQILSGYTRREAHPVGPQTRRRMLGGE